MARRCGAVPRLGLDRETNLMGRPKIHADRAAAQRAAKTAERQRKAEAGQKTLQVTVSASAAVELDVLAAAAGLTRSETVERLILGAGEGWEQIG